ncbi:MAG TPA: plastocyanin/azurin family copper-binding protein [Chloroflexota bacterium]|nr:plastocyanin/azurin family copper-binding protein [Chloroflexota bacterium]
MKHILVASLAAVAVCTVLLAPSLGHASSPHRAPSSSPVHHYVITAGWGDDDYAANVYTPSTLHIYAGDSVTWRVRERLEPHTVSFGPMALLGQLAKNSVNVVPQPNGPPQFELNPQAAFPTRSNQVSGAGFVNSGLLRKGQSWTAVFPRPGVYHYYCLLHFPGMTGTVVVLPRTNTPTVETGYGTDRSAVDAYFPENLTIKVGTTVTWSPGFHTVTFAPMAEVHSLRRHFIVPVRQSNGTTALALNPRVALPSGGKTYTGGFWNSGLLVQGPVSLTFPKPGVYHYHCLVHPGMDGTITVKP